MRFLTPLRAPEPHLLHVRTSLLFHENFPRAEGGRGGGDGAEVSGIQGIGRGDLRSG